jgi:hypothetical protein
LISDRGASVASLMISIRQGDEDEEMRRPATTTMYMHGSSGSHNGSSVHAAGGGTGTELGNTRGRVGQWRTGRPSPPVRRRVPRTRAHALRCSPRSTTCCCWYYWITADLNSRHRAASVVVVAGHMAVRAPVPPTRRRWAAPTPAGARRRMTPGGGRMCTGGHAGDACVVGGAKRSLLIRAASCSCERQRLPDEFEWPGSVGLGVGERRIFRVIEWTPRREE